MIPVILQLSFIRLHQTTFIFFKDFNSTLKSGNNPGFLTMITLITTFARPVTK